MNQRKEIWANKCSKCYSLLYTIYGKTIKGKTKHKRKNYPYGSCQSVSFLLKTDYTLLKTSKMNERACMSKHLKWNNFPFYRSRLPGNLFHGDEHHQTASLRKSLKWNRIPLQGDRLSGEITLSK